MAVTHWNQTIYLEDHPHQEQKLLQQLAAGEIKAFWPLWQQHREYLFRCCLRWTNGNSTEAEDVLSQAMLKAWEKVQKFAGKIANFKFWLVTLIRNFWLDLKRRRGATSVEDIEVYAAQEELGLLSVDDTPGSALEREDKKMVIRRAIDNLPPRLRETFSLHFYEELSYQEIGEKQNITYQNVCKRISQAREILREELRGYFMGEEGTEPDTAKVVAKPVKSKKAAEVEPILPETEPSNSSVNTKYSNPQPEEETGLLPPTEILGETTDQEAIGFHREPTQTSDFIQGASIGGASIAPLPLPYCHSRILFCHSRLRGNPISPAQIASTGRSPQHPYHYPTLRNRVSVRNLTGETEILVKTRFLDPHLLSFPRRRKSTFPYINTSTNTGIDSS